MIIGMAIASKANKNPGKRNLIGPKLRINPDATIKNDVYSTSGSNLMV